MTQCQAAHCPEDDIGDEHFFCQLHWDILPQASKDALGAAFGTENWQVTLAEAIRALVLAEGDLGPKLCCCVTPNFHERCDHQAEVAGYCKTCYGRCLSVNADE